jgi:hypothetical protein
MGHFTQTQADTRLIARPERMAACARPTPISVRWFPKDPPARQGARLPIHSTGMKVSIAVIAEA